MLLPLLLLPLLLLLLGPAALLGSLPLFLLPLVLGVPTALLQLLLGWALLRFDNMVVIIN
jgi:hypothetical protein